MKTAKITLESIKSYGWGALLTELGLVNTDPESGKELASGEAQAKVAAHFEYEEFASIEIEVDENLNIISGKFLPFKKINTVL